MGDRAKIWLKLGIAVSVLLVIALWVLPEAARQLVGIPPADDPDCLRRADEVDSWPFVWIDPEDLCRRR